MLRPRIFCAIINTLYSTPEFKFVNSKCGLLQKKTQKTLFIKKERVVNYSFVFFVITLTFLLLDADDHQLYTLR